MVITLKKRSLAFILVTAMIFTFMPPLFFMEKAEAYSVNAIHLKNGDTCNISGKPKNTIIYISDKSTGSNGKGEVTLEGSSTKVWVHIAVSKGKTVKVNLKGDLSIIPGSASAYGTGPNNDTLGWSRSAIYIDETSKKSRGGTVILNSMPGARVTLDSYQCGIWQALPAIMKNNTETKLIFTTEDSSNPGTIIARPSFKTGVHGSVAIGAYGHGALGFITSSYTVGNIEFASGNIEAYGRVDGPGIGAYEYSHIGEIKFTGAHVISKAGNFGNKHTMVGAAGIGTCYRGNIDKISISGGYVEAWGMGSLKDTKGYSTIRIQDTAGCGIGGGWFGSHIGEIEIKGGTVKAYGGTCNEADGQFISGCGIGTTVLVGNDIPECTADKITITGGDITAVGGNLTCGIGGCVKDITIAPASPDTELRINASIDSRPDKSGKRSAMGSGIGTANNVRIGHYSRDDYPGNITIKGGDITATAGSIGDSFNKKFFGGSGIGPTSHGRVSSLTISGGRINASGGWNSPGIGGPNGCADHYLQTVDSIRITGGTITSTAATYNGKGCALSGIGGYKDGNGERTDIRITGGSIITEDGIPIGYDEDPKNDADETLEWIKFSFNPDVEEWTEVTSFTTDPGLGYDYGINDVFIKEDIDDTDVKIVEFWIPRKINPEDGYMCRVDTASSSYSAFDGNFNPVKLDTGRKIRLDAFTDITYINKVDGGNYTGRGVYGYKLLSIDPAPEKSGKMSLYDLKGYEDEKGKRIADGKYGQSFVSLVKNTQYANADGEWKWDAKKLKLYFILEQTDYLVEFDANQPANASHSVSGYMSGDVFSITESCSLPQNGYGLTGWDFAGWNTKRDGTGRTFADGGSITYDPDWGEKLTLYAQWTPKGYDVTFDSGLNEGLAQKTQEAHFDTSLKLLEYSDEAFGWQERSNRETQELLGWSAEGFGSFYSDNEDIINFIEKDAGGEPVFDDKGNLKGRTLTAVWVDKGKIAAAVTKDNIPLGVSGSNSITKGDFILENDQGDEFGLPDPVATGNTLVFDPAHVSTGSTTGQLPHGHYYLYFNPALNDQTQVTDPENYIALCMEFDYVGKTVSSVFDYYTVSTNEDDHIANSFVRVTGTSEPDKTIEVPDDSSVIIGASANEGYHFDGWSYYGVEPEWDPYGAEQTIIINGTVDLTAHAAPDIYHISFNKNKPSDATHDVEGSMTDQQDFVFDEPQKLTKNDFSLTGWTFTGWNTEADGSGVSLSDMAEIDAAKWTEIGPPEDDAEVMLYAQWEPDKYTVYFYGNGAGSGTMSPQELTYDTPQKLETNTFARTDWQFTGWNTEPAGGGTSYEDGQEVCNLTAGGSITLFAQWEHDYYTILFDRNSEDAEGEMPDARVNTNCRYELPPCNFWRRGYTPESWNTKPDGSGRRYETDEIIENAAPKGETLVLYAQWKPNTYNVHFDANGGNGSMQDQKFTYDVPQRLAAAGFSKKHYALSGWNTEADGEGLSFADMESVKNLTIYPDHTVILYAQWEKEKYVITYDLNGGTLDGKKGTVKVTCTYGDVIKLPKPERKGYKFAYWKGSRYKAGANYKVTGDHTLTAQWEKVGVETGDSSSLPAWMVLLLLSTAAFAGSVLLRLRRK